LRERDLVAQPVADCGGQPDQQQAVFARIVRKNIAEARRDHAADTEVAERPYRMFARRAAAEIAVGDQYLRAAGCAAVQDEILTLQAIGRVAQFLEQMPPQSGA